jgi:hypothetical protein
MENWKAVVGYEGLYEVSDIGRVRAIARVTCGRWGARPLKARIMKPVLKRATGYYAISLCKSGLVKQPSVHKLVLEAFVGPRPDGMEACHWDGDRTNAALSNLRWDTRLNNALDRKRHGTDLLGERAKSARLTESLVREIRKRNKSARAWAKELGVGLQTVCRARSGITWAHVVG